MVRATTIQLRFGRLGSILGGGFNGDEVSLIKAASNQ